MIASAVEVVRSVRTLLAYSQSVVGAFVYGSVARGTAAPGSDIDLFVVTSGQPEDRDRLREGAAALQRQLGYYPDPDHPIEAFTAASCVAALAGPQVTRALDMVAAGRDVDSDLLECDDLEILRALCDRRIDVLPSPVLGDLRELARARISAASRVDIPADRLLVMLGLARATGTSR